MTNSRNRLILFSAAIIAILVTLLITRPWLYFVTNAVDEAFPAFSAEQRAAIRDMPIEQQETLIQMAADTPQMATDTALAMLEPNVIMDEAMPAMDEPIILASGSFIQIDPVHGAEGTATIYQLPNGERVLRFEDFRSTNGPDLRIYLSTTVPTTTFAGLGENALYLEPLKGNVGNQNYTLPVDADLSLYRSIVLWCEPFGVVFSSAALNAS